MRAERCDGPRPQPLSRRDKDHDNPTDSTPAVRAAAADVLAGFRRELASAPLTRPPEMAVWALRLADALGAVLAENSQRCCRCRIAPVHQPGALRPDGYPQDGALYCAACIDRCHEATDMGHVCVICAGPDELASGLVPGAGAGWREAIRQAVDGLKAAKDGGQELNATAQATLAEHGITPAEWARRHFPCNAKPGDLSTEIGQPVWLGDACGCPDDRCIGYHHDGPDDCGCLPALLKRPADDEPEPEDYDPGPEVDDEGGMSEYRYVLPDDPRDADFTGGYVPGIEGD